MAIKQIYPVSKTSSVPFKLGMQQNQNRPGFIDLGSQRRDEALQKRAYDEAYKRALKEHQSSMDTKFKQALTSMPSKNLGYANYSSALQSWIDQNREVLGAPENYTKTQQILKEQERVISRESQKDLQKVISTPIKGTYQEKAEALGDVINRNINVLSRPENIKKAHEWINTQQEKLDKEYESLKSQIQSTPIPATYKKVVSAITPKSSEEKQAKQILDSISKPTGTIITDPKSGRVIGGNYKELVGMQITPEEKKLISSGMISSSSINKPNQQLRELENYYTKSAQAYELLGRTDLAREFQLAATEISLYKQQEPQITYAVPVQKEVLPVASVSKTTSTQQIIPLNVAAYSLSQQLGDLKGIEPTRLDKLRTTVSGFITKKSELKVITPAQEKMIDLRTDIIKQELQLNQLTSRMDNLMQSPDYKQFYEQFYSTPEKTQRTVKMIETAEKTGSSSPELITYVEKYQSISPDLLLKLESLSDTAQKKSPDYISNIEKLQTQQQDYYQGVVGMQETQQKLEKKTFIDSVKGLSSKEAIAKRESLVSDYQSFKDQAQKSDAFGTISDDKKAEVRAYSSKELRKLSKSDRELIMILEGPGKLSQTKWQSGDYTGAILSPIISYPTKGLMLGGEALSAFSKSNIESTDKQLDAIKNFSFKILDPRSLTKSEEQLESKDMFIEISPLSIAPKIIRESSKVTLGAGDYLSTNPDAIARDLTIGAVTTGISTGVQVYSATKAAKLAIATKGVSLVDKVEKGTKATKGVSGTMGLLYVGSGAIEVGLAPAEKKAEVLGSRLAQIGTFYLGSGLMRGGISTAQTLRLTDPQYSAKLLALRGGKISYFPRKVIKIDKIYDPPEYRYGVNLKSLFTSKPEIYTRTWGYSFSTQKPFGKLIPETLVPKGKSNVVLGEFSKIKMTSPKTGKEIYGFTTGFKKQSAISARLQKYDYDQLFNLGQEVKGLPMANIIPKIRSRTEFKGIYESGKLLVERGLKGEVISQEFKTDLTGQKRGSYWMGDEIKIVSSKTSMQPNQNVVKQIEFLKKYKPGEQYKIVQEGSSYIIYKKSPRTGDVYKVLKAGIEEKRAAGELFATDYTFKPVLKDPKVEKVVTTRYDKSEHIMFKKVPEGQSPVTVPKLKTKSKKLFDVVQGEIKQEPLNTKLLSESSITTSSKDYLVITTKRGVGKAYPAEYFKDVLIPKSLVKKGTSPITEQQTKTLTESFYGYGDDLSKVRIISDVSVIQRATAAKVQAIQTRIVDTGVFVKPINEGSIIAGPIKKGGKEIFKGFESVKSSKDFFNQKPSSLKLFQGYGVAVKGKKGVNTAQVLISEKIGVRESVITGKKGRGIVSESPYSFELRKGIKEPTETTRAIIEKTTTKPIAEQLIKDDIKLDIFLKTKRYEIRESPLTGARSYGQDIVNFISDLKPAKKVAEYSAFTVRGFSADGSQKSIDLFYHKGKLVNKDVMDLDYRYTPKEAKEIFTKMTAPQQPTKVSKPSKQFLSKLQPKSQPTKVKQEIIQTTSGESQVVSKPTTQQQFLQDVTAEYKPQQTIIPGKTKPVDIPSLSESMFIPKMRQASAQATKSFSMFATLPQMKSSLQYDLSPSSELKSYQVPETKMFPDLAEKYKMDMKIYPDTKLYPETKMYPDTKLYPETKMYPDTKIDAKTKAVSKVISKQLLDTQLIQVQKQKYSFAKLGSSFASPFTFQPTQPKPPNPKSPKLTPLPYLPFKLKSKPKLKKRTDSKDYIKKEFRVLELLEQKSNLNIL